MITVRHPVSLYHGKSAITEPRNLLFAEPIVTGRNFLFFGSVFPHTGIFPGEIARLIGPCSHGTPLPPLHRSVEISKTRQSYPLLFPLLRFITGTAHKIALKRLNGAFVSPATLYHSATPPTK